MSRRGRPRHRRQPRVETPEFDGEADEAAYWEAEGRRCAIDGMDLPDGAYFAMLDDAGLDPL